MTDAGEVREMWSWGEGEEPERKRWRLSGMTRYDWEQADCPPIVAREGEGVFPTKDAAIRHAIAETERDLRVMERGAEAAREKVVRLMGMLEEEGDGNPSR